MLLALYDTSGNFVRPLASGDYEAGRHTVMLARAGLLPGGYAVRLTVGDQMLTLKVALY